MTGHGRYEPGNAGMRLREGVEAPVRPVLSGRRGARQRLGLVGVAAVAVTVLAAGIGLGERREGLDPSASDSSPDASTTARPSTSTGPRGTSTPGPTPLNASGCVPLDPADGSDLRLRSSSGVSKIASGVEAQPGWELASPPSSAWPIPRPTAGLIVESSDSIVLFSPDDACLESVEAEYLAVDDLGLAPTPLGPGAIDVDPPRQYVALGGIPIGDWLVHVAVAFATGVAGEQDTTPVHRFFRVTTSVNPAVSPEITPALPCGTPDAEGPPGLLLQIGDGEPVRGVDADEHQGNIANNGALVEGSGTEPLILSIEGDACATSWKVEWLDNYGSQMFEVVQLNRTENPYLVSQNRIVLEPEQDIFGHIAILATVQLGLGRTVRAAWELQRTGPPLPPIAFAGPDGVPVAGVGSCGGSWNFADGRSAWEMCDDPPIIPESVLLLTVRSGDIVTILPPGMTIDNWAVACGERGGPGGTEFVHTGCDLGGGNAEPMHFLPYPGRSIVQAYVSMRIGDDQAWGPYYVEILAER